MNKIDRSQKTGYGANALNMARAAHTTGKLEIMHIRHHRSTIAVIGTYDYMWCTLPWFMPGLSIQGPGNPGILLYLHVWFTFTHLRIVQPEMRSVLSECIFMCTMIIDHNKHTVQYAKYIRYKNFLWTHAHSHSEKTTN